jgi:hypothetical protein
MALVLLLRVPLVPLHSTALVMQVHQLSTSHGLPGRLYKMGLFERGAENGITQAEKQ